MSSLTIVCPNARRCKISVTPGTSLRQVLEECCLKQGYDVDSHILMHRNKALDDSLPFRLTGIPNNACLDLVEVTEKKVDQEVEIALQAPDGRKIAKFISTTTLSDLLKKFSEEFGHDLVNTGEGKAATITYLNKQWKGESLLSSTTLKSIGITSGRVLLRYSVAEFTDEEKAKVEESLSAENERRKKMEEEFIKQKAENDARAAMEAKYQKEFEERKAAADKQRMEEEEARREEYERQQSARPDLSMPANEMPPSNAQSQAEIERLEATLRILNSSLQTGRSDSLVDTLLTERGTLRSDIEMRDISQAAQTPFQPPLNEFANFKFPEKKIKVPYETDDEPKIKEEINFASPQDRHVVIFDRTMSEEKKKALEEVDESVYETTLQDIKVLHRSLVDQANGQRAFVPKSFIDEKNHERKLKAYKNTVIRFLLPNNKALQACFYSQESVGAVHKFVESLLINKNVKYDICFFLKEKLQNDNFKNLIDAGLAPKSNLILSIKEANAEQFFDPNRLHQVTMEEADLESNRWLEANTKYEPYNPTVGAESQTSQNKRNIGAIVDQGESSGPPSQRRNVEGMPKWMKR